MTSTCWGAGRRTDRFSDGIKPLQLRDRPLAAVPLLPLYRKTRVEGTISSGGGEDARLHERFSRRAAAMAEDTHRFWAKLEGSTALQYALAPGAIAVALLLQILVIGPSFPV